MAENATFPKDPEADLDYKFDWASWLDAGDTISSYVLTAQTGITAHSDSNSTTAVTVWVSGGTAGNMYSLECKIVTAAGRTDERTIFFVVYER